MITFVIVYVCIAVIWAGLVRALLESKYGAQPEIEETLEQHNITRSTASIINGAIWPYSIPLFLYRTLKGFIGYSSEEDS